MKTTLNTKCECGGTLVVIANSASHDEKKIDLLVLCEGKCRKVLNAFVSLSDMVTVHQ